MVKEERTFDDKKFNYEYDLNGFLLQKIEYGMAGNDDVFLKTNYLRDRFGRLLEKTLPDESVIRYTYDKFGNLTTVDDGKWPIGYTYDDRQRLIAEHQGFYTTYFAYDGVDNLIAITLEIESI